MPIEEHLRRKLERGHVETESLEGPEGRKDARARALIAAPVEKVFEVVTDYANYKHFMPYTTVSEVKRREGDQVWFYTELKFPLKTIRYEIKCRLDRASWTASWTLVEGNLKSNEGSWKLEPYGPDETYAIYTVYIDPGFPIPGYILNKLTQGSLPMLIEAVRRRSGDRKYV